MLIAAIVGLDTRSTMGLDTTLRNYPLTEEKVESAVREICEIWGYNIETVLAEKVETILSRGIFNTRPRDFYDIYILVKNQKYNKKLFAEALIASAEHRGTLGYISDMKEILQQIADSKELRQDWKKYQNKFVYAREIVFDDIIKVLEELLSIFMTLE